MTDRRIVLNAIENLKNRYFICNAFGKSEAEQALKIACIDFYEFDIGCPLEITHLSFSEELTEEELKDLRVNLLLNFLEGRKHI